MRELIEIIDGFENDPNIILGVLNTPEHHPSIVTALKEINDVKQYISAETEYGQKSIRSAIPRGKREDLIETLTINYSIIQPVLGDGNSRCIQTQQIINRLQSIIL